MAKLRPRAAESAHSRDQHKDPLRGFSVEQVLDGQRPGAVDPEADQRWMSARRWAHAKVDSRYDPRSVLTMTSAAAADWRGDRAAWLRTQTSR